MKTLHSTTNTQIYTKQQTGLHSCNVTILSGSINLSSFRISLAKDGKPNMFLHSITNFSLTF